MAHRWTKEQTGCREYTMKHYSAGMNLEDITLSETKMVQEEKS